MNTESFSEKQYQLNIVSKSLSNVLVFCVFFFLFFYFIWTIVQQTRSIFYWNLFEVVEVNTKTKGLLPLKLFKRSCPLMTKHLAWVLGNESHWHHCIYRATLHWGIECNLLDFHVCCLLLKLLRFCYQQISNLVLYIHKLKYFSRGVCRCEWVCTHIQK